LGTFCMYFGRASSMPSLGARVAAVALAVKPCAIKERRVRQSLQEILYSSVVFALRVAGCFQVFPLFSSCGAFLDVYSTWDSQTILSEITCLCLANVIGSYLRAWFWNALWFSPIAPGDPVLREYLLCGSQDVFKYFRSSPHVGPF